MKTQAKNNKKIRNYLNQLRFPQGTFSGEANTWGWTIECCCNAGPPSATLVQHYINIGSTSAVCRVITCWFDVYDGVVLNQLPFINDPFTKYSTVPMVFINDPCPTVCIFPCAGKHVKYAIDYFTSLWTDYCGLPIVHCTACPRMRCQRAFRPTYIRGIWLGGLQFSRNHRTGPLNLTLCMVMWTCVYIVPSSLCIDRWAYLVFR